MAGGSDSKFVDVFSGFGGAAASFGMAVSVGEFDGRWLLFSLQGLTIPPGYYHLTTLVTESLSALNCVPGSLGLIETVISDIGVSLTIEEKKGAL